MFKKILLALLVLVIGLVVTIASRPADFTITRTATMAAPPSAVFTKVNEFRLWQTWSPWEKLDPQLKRTFEGPQAGLGSIYSWMGNKEAGEGRMTIIESRPSELVRIKLEFLKPFAVTNISEFTLKPEGERTLVNWTMTGHNNFFLKAFGLFMNMDKMIGGDFERGLANLQTLVEAENKK